MSTHELELLKSSLLRDWQDPTTRKAMQRHPMWTCFHTLNMQAGRIPNWMLYTVIQAVSNAP